MRNNAGDDDEDDHDNKEYYVMWWLIFFSADDAMLVADLVMVGKDEGKTRKVVSTPSRIFMPGLSSKEEEKKKRNAHFVDGDKEDVA